MKTLSLMFSAAIVAMGATSAGHAASLFVPGSTFQVQAGNSPDTFNDTVNLTPGTQSLDGGAVDLNISIVPAAGGVEWLVFNYTTTSGGPLGNGDWSLNQVGLDAAVPINFIGAYSEFLVNGVSQPWSYSFFGGYEPGSNPVPGLTGTGVVNISPFNDPQPAGPLGALGAFIDPYSGYLTSAGIDPTMVNGYTQALEFVAQAPSTPEASTWVMMLAGFAGLGFLGYRQTAKARVAAA
jgi:hypothetical protein